MVAPVLDDRQGFTYISSGQILNVILRNCQERWMIGTDVDLWQNRPSGISDTVCSNCLNKRTAHVGWQAEADHVNYELVSVVKLYIHGYLRQNVRQLVTSSQGGHGQPFGATTKSGQKPPRELFGAWAVAHVGSRLTTHLGSRQT